MEEQTIIFCGRSLCFGPHIRYPDFEIRRGEITFLVGESGTGKSTLLRLLNATRNASAGTLQFCGQDIINLEAVALRQKVLLVSQSVYLFDQTIRENFMGFYSYREILPPSEKKMEKFLALCCAPFALDRNCATLSGGERQRVYLAIHLSLHPEVLLLDEPTSALDSQTSGALLSNMISFCEKQQITLVVVSHDTGLTLRFAEKTIVLKGGESDAGNR